MKKYFDVEVLGREVSIYGGIDGHEVGTHVVGHWLGDIMQLDGGDIRVQVCTNSVSGRTYVVFKGSKYIVSNTRNLAVYVPFSKHDVVLAIMGTDKVGENFDKYFKISCNLDLSGLSLDEFKDIVKRIM